jgi:hypothetical protein
VTEPAAEPEREIATTALEDGAKVYAEEESATSPPGGTSWIEELLTEEEVLAASFEPEALEIEALELGLLASSPQAASMTAIAHIPKIRPVSPPALIPIGPSHVALIPKGLRRPCGRRAAV